MENQLQHDVNRSLQGQKLRRAGAACIACHRRKVRCDGASVGFPCSNCAASREVCSPRERRKRAIRALSVPSGNTAASHRPSHTSPHEHVSQDTSSPINVSEQIPDVPTSISEESELAKHHLYDFINQDLHNNPIKARLQYIGTDMSNIYHLVRQNASKTNIYHYPCGEIHAPRRFQSSQPPATPNLIPKDAFVLPPRHVSDILIQNYFDFVAPGLPIIDEAAFMAAYNDPTLQPPFLLLQVICLVGAHVDKTFGNTTTLKAAFYRRAKALFDGRYEEDRMYMVQAAILMTWMSDGPDDVGANSWYWIGLATRSAIGLGMHRDVIPSNMPPSDKRLWRRLWWVLFQFDCLVSLSHGRPQTINLDDCDVPPLSPNDFERSGHSSEVNFVIEHTKLCVLISGFIRSHTSLKATMSAKARKAVDAGLANWLINLPEDLRMRTSQGSTRISFWPAMLHSTYNTVLLLLHRVPPNRLSDSESNSVSISNDSDICLYAGNTLTQIFEDLRQQDLMRYCWCWTSSFLFTTIIQISVEMRSASPILATSALTKFDSVMNSIRELANHWLFASSILRLFEHSSDRLQQYVMTTAQSIRNTPEPRASSPPAIAMQVNGQPELIQSAPIEDLSHDQHNISKRARFVEPDRTALGPTISQPNLTNLGESIDDLEWLAGHEGWEASYHGDPLANLRLDDTWGDLGFLWQ